MKKRKIYILIVFALAIFAVTNSLRQKEEASLLNGNLAYLTQVSKAQAEDTENKRPLYQNSSGLYCCGNTQTTSCGAVACE
jgi:hypothetical protein